MLVAMVWLAGWSAPAAAQSNSASTAPNIAAGFVLRPGDVLRIRVWPDSGLSGEYPIEESGLAYLPVLGAIQVAGVPLDELRADLRRRYGMAMRVPVVTITPLFHVSVLGAVHQPGLYQLTPTHTLYDVIGMAGGFARDARDDRLRVVRDGRVLEVNVKRALSTGESLAAIELRSGDQIVVPERRSVLSVQNVSLTLQIANFVITLIYLIQR